MNEALDEKWFGRVHKLNAQIPRRLKVGNYQEAKRRFMRDSSSEPSFEFPFLNSDTHHQKVLALHELQSDIIASQDTHPIVKDLYQEKIKEKLKQFKIVEEIAEGNVREVQTLVESVYGAPDLKVFQDLVFKLHQRLLTLPRDEQVTTHYNRLELICSGVTESSVAPFEPIPAPEDVGEVLTDARAVREYILAMLPEFGLESWRVQISCDSVGGFKIWPLTKRIIVPTSKMLQARVGRRRLTKSKLDSIIAHEVQTHALRAENGLRSPLKLLSIGLAGYWPGEEGIAEYREQQIIGATDYANKRMHLAIGLAYGLDRNNEKRSFREVYDILTSYYLLLHTHNELSARRKAFASCARIFKGARGNATAYINTKDIAYREGNIAIYVLLKNNPKALRWFDVGKFDPTNEVHVRSLQELGIICK